MLRQVWAIFGVKKWLQLLGCITQSFEERWQQTNLTCTKPFHWRGRLEPFYETTKQIECWSRKPFKRKKNFCSVQIPTKSKGTDEKPKLAQSSWHCGPSKQKTLRYSAAVQPRHANEFTFPKRISFKGDGKREFSTKCFCQL